MITNKYNIVEWLNKYNLFDYELIKDEKYGYIVNINSNVDLRYNDLHSIDIKFNIINGYFNCSHNKLTSLKGSPKVITNNFYCNNNLLTSLEHSPHLVKGDFDCTDNNLSILNCHNQQLIFGNFWSNLNNLDVNSLYSLPNVKGNIYLHSNNKLGNLQNIENFQLLKNTITAIKQKKEISFYLNNDLITNSNRKIHKI